MKHLLHAIRVTENTPSATKHVFGVSIPPREFAVPAPAQELAAPGVSVSVQKRGTDGLALVSPRVIRWAWAQIERHPVGDISYDVEGLARRLSAFDRLLTELPADVPPEHAPFVVGHAAHLGVGALGLRVEDVVGATSKRCPGHSAEDITAWASAAVDGGTFYPYDQHGQALDEDAARKRAEQEASRVEFFRVEAEVATPNERTLDELGWLAFESTFEAFHRGPAPLHRLRQLRAGTRLFAVAPRAGLAGTFISEAGVALGIELLPGDFVLPLTRAEVDAHAAHESGDIASLYTSGADVSAPFAQWWFEELRPMLGIETGNPRKEEHDESTIDGRYRVELLERIARDELLPNPKAPAFDYRMRVLFDAGINGLSLADDVVASALNRRIAERWQGVTRPAWCASEDALLTHNRAKRVQRRPLFAIDELYVSPEPTMLQRVASIFRTGDAWAPSVEAFVAAKEVVRSVDIEGHLLAGGLVSALPLRGPASRRVFNIMTKLGWTKADRPVDGRRVKCWVKNGALK